FTLPRCRDDMDLHSFRTRRPSDLARRFALKRHARRAQRTCITGTGMAIDRATEFSGTQEVREQHRFDVSKLQAFMEKNVEGFSGDRKSTRLNSSHVKIS